MTKSERIKKLEEQITELQKLSIIQRDNARQLTVKVYELEWLVQDLQPDFMIDFDPDFKEENNDD